VWTALIGAVSAIAVIGILSAVFAAPATTTTLHPSASTVPAASATVPALPAPSPDGTYQGSCDYLLDVGGQMGAYALVGEIDLSNTGNVGVIVHTRITWPQEGSPPVTMRKTVHLPFGATDKPVRFRMSATSEEIDALQSWQGSHDFKDGCTYHASFASTYGPAH
jgi:hypothetical protein